MQHEPATGSMASLVASVGSLGARLLTLIVLEGKQAGRSLLWMLGLALAAAVLALGGWLALLSGLVVLLVDSGGIGWGGALSIAVLLSFALAGGMVFMLIRRSRYLSFPATLRQFERLRAGESRLG